jgi:hypothetical protein
MRKPDLHRFVPKVVGRALNNRDPHGLRQGVRHQGVSATELKGSRNGEHKAICRRAIYFGELSKPGKILIVE